MVEVRLFTGVYSRDDVGSITVTDEEQSIDFKDKDETPFEAKYLVLTSIDIACHIRFDTADNKQHPLYRNVAHRFSRKCSTLYVVKQDGEPDGTLIYKAFS